MSNGASFVDTNVWLYRLFDDKRIPVAEKEKKRSIATNVTSVEVIISTQVINEICANLLKKAAFNEQQIKAVIQSLCSRCIVVNLNISILEYASDIRSRYSVSFWDGLILASALSAGANILYSEDMQDGLIVNG